MKPMMKILLTSVVILAGLGTTVFSQTVTNNGVVVFLNKKSIFTVCGNMNINNNGSVLALDSSYYLVKGTVNLNSGKIVFNDAAISDITVDLNIAGVPCGNAAGEVDRLGTGKLTVHQDINNDGVLNNDGTIHVMKNWNNRGQMNNSTGALFDVGP